MTNNEFVHQEEVLTSLYSRIDKAISYGDKIVITDLDGTLYRDSLYLNIYHKLCERGMLSQQALSTYQMMRDAWKNRKMSYDDFLYSTIDFYTKEMVNFHKNDLDSIISDIIENDFGRIYVSTKGLIEAYKKQGYKIVIVSGSPDIIVTEFAKRMGYHLGIGTFEAVDEKGFLTGERFVMAKNENKMRVIDCLYSKYRPTHTVVFGDSTGDLGMLLHANLGYCVNPPRDLYEAIYDNETINVVIERKNLSLMLDKNARKLTKIIG